MRAAFFAWEGCSLYEVYPLLTTLVELGDPVKTLTFGGTPIRTTCGVTIQPDAAVERVNPRDYPLLLLPNGNVTDVVMEDPRLHRFIRQLNTQPNAWLSAVGDSCLILAASGELGGMRYTGPKDCADRIQRDWEFSHYTDTDVCVDGNVITAKPFAYEQFTQAVCHHVYAVAPK